MAELVHKLKPYISVFSAALPTQCKHGDKVTVGGKVTSVLNLMDILKHAQEESFQKEGVYVTLDDAIGEVQICVGPKAYDNYVKKHGSLKVGEVILAEGRVHRLDTTHTYQGARGKRVTVDKHKQETIRVLSYQLAPLPEEPTKNVIKEL